MPQVKSQRHFGERIDQIFTLVSSQDRTTRSWPVIRNPGRLMPGLMWYSMNDYSGAQNIRHICNQEDKLSSYAYTKHSLTFATQQIIDDVNNIKLDTHFATTGLDWGVRITGQTTNTLKSFRNNVLFYLSGQMNYHSEKHVLSGSRNGSSFVIKLEKTMLLFGIHVPKHQEFRMTEHLMQRIQHKLSSVGYQQGNPLPPVDDILLFKQSMEDNSNVFIIQGLYDTQFNFDIVYQESNDVFDLDMLLERKKVEFDTEFNQKYKLLEKGYTEQQNIFAKMLLSNLIGGIGYFHGKQVVNRHASEFPDEIIDIQQQFSSQDDYFGPVTTKIYTDEEEGPYSLFTATPSRSFFPRGFLWDEGFHQLVISSYDSKFSMDMLKSWGKLVDDDGWVARELILGQEARSRVPEEFQTQFTHYANPPTLILPLHSILKKNSDKKIIDDGKNIYEGWKRRYEWFKRTQAGISSGYRWRGRQGFHTLTSGLDDYPRGDFPKDGEMHLDLACWVAVMAKNLEQLSLVYENGDSEKYKEEYEALLLDIDNLHWDATNGMYSDVSTNNYDENIFVGHVGYVSLFPMMLGLIPASSEKLEKALDIIRDPTQLWSGFGIRSLSKQDPYYRKGEDYWRGNIWININYLLLQSLHNYSKISGPYQKRCEIIYKELRADIVSNVFKRWVETGFVWEQYSGDDGQGKRSHPFTGWTSLVLLIMAEIYE